MSVVLRILFLTLVPLSAAIDFYCENDVTEESFCLIERVEVSHSNPVCRMQFPKESSIQLRSAYLHYLSPYLMYRMEVVKRLDILSSNVDKAFIKPELESLKIAGSNLIELVIDPAEEYRLTELHLTANGLTCLPRHLSHLKYLTSLDLSDNKLDYVDMTSLNGLSSLATIKLDSNRIKAVFATGAVQLKALTYASFAKNGISLMDVSRWETPLLSQFDITSNNLERLDGFPENFTSLQIVGLTYNPWNCDWQMQAKKVLQERQVQVDFEGFICHGSDQSEIGISVAVLRKQKTLKQSVRVSIAKVVRNATGGKKVEFDDLIDELFCRIYAEENTESSPERSSILF